MLLDVQMPGLSGFDVVEQVSGEHLPLVLFVTAYDEYALQAFQVHAFDYLLKPVNPARLAEAIGAGPRRSRARRRRRGSG